MFVDTATILVRSGKGGDGAVSFRREKFIPKGGPNGGDGGKGGNVILVATQGVDTLLDFAGRHHWRADDGRPGARKQQIGRSAEDLIVKVPPGTLVYDDQAGQLLEDLDCVGKQVVVARGGKGGYGNEHFKSATNQTPRESTPGEPAEEKTLRLELKLIADVGLVGKPNAGKSTLLSVVSKARPKIADYPFTTLQPHLGIADLGGHRRLVIADIPGLIEGAHRGHGLGTQFLRHIERTRLLVHLLEIEPVDGSDPVDNYRAICQELAGYSQELASKPQVVVLSKMDTCGSAADGQAAAAAVQDALGLTLLPISSATGQNVSELLEQCWRLSGKKTEDRWADEGES